MAGQGTGPSRRSHTKSRTGCKTCKRRHIRCDETFPQCRNCTKHQVRCDYMENLPAERDSQPPPESSSVPSTPGSEQIVDIWLQTGNFPYPELQVFPAPQPQSYSRSDLHLITHISSIARSLLLNGTSEMNVWTPRIPQYLSIASSYPYVMHAYLAFSASHLAWASPASDVRKLQIQHGGIALRGLHDSISSFSKSNADSVLAASLLLMTQANDWRTWSSLQAGIRSVSSAMEGWKHESLFADIINIIPSLRFEDPRPLPSLQERQAVLTSIVSSLQRLQPSLAGHEAESQWIAQLLGYVRTLLGSQPAQTPAEQFDQLYRLRKWVLFVPSVLLERPVVEGPAILVLAHLYATALAVEPLFPSLGPSFCAAISFGPLERIIQTTAPMQMEQHFGQNALEIAALMQFPQQAANNYRHRMAWVQQQQVEQARLHHPVPQGSFQGSLNMDMENLAYIPFANQSPGFVPSSLDARHSRMSSGSHSPYLELPTTGIPYDNTGFFYGANEWGAPSPGFPSQPYMVKEEEHGYESEIGTPYGGFSGGSTPHRHRDSKGKGRQE